MKNNSYIKFFLVILYFLSIVNLNAEELNIKALNIKVDKKTFDVIFKDNVVFTDPKNNKFEADYSIYNKKKQRLISEGQTKIITSSGYNVYTKDILLDNLDGIISSERPTKIIDLEGNKIFVEMFEYNRNTNIFYSVGEIRVEDINENTYNFSEVYIDEKKEKIVGSDVRVFLNQESLKAVDKNNPRIFANSMTLSSDKNEMGKAVCTYCKYRENGKAPPWSIKADKIKHSPAEKTIYYTNAVLKVFNFPIFYLPTFFHPDPTVERRSGFLNPTIVNSSNIGSGFSTPYFWDISNDRDLTFTPKIYFNNNPLALAEYRQDYENSYLIIDTGFTKGYKKTTNKKLPGNKNHLFAKFVSDLSKDSDSISSNVEFNIQHVSNESYVRVYDLETSLVSKNMNILENSLQYDYFTNDTFFGANIAAYENTKIVDNKKYEYFAPYLTFDKNISNSENFGSLDLSSNLRVRNYDVNKQTEFLVNDLNWKSIKSLSNFGFETQFKGLLKGVNYDAKNTKNYKNDNFNSELSGAIGYLAKLPFYKKGLVDTDYHLFTPKLLLRYAPGHMRNINDNVKLNYNNIFSLNRLNQIDVLEKGASTSLGFQYEKKSIDTEKNINKTLFSTSFGQIINENENRDLPAPINQRFSDLIGETKWSPDQDLSIKYNYSIDQNYKEFNYNELGAEITNGRTKFNISYLEERDYYGTQEYIKSDVDISLNDSNILSFGTKRNLLKNSSDYYNLSYEYFNDCMRAGLVYRREFYNDKDIEPENSLMFTIKIVPFGNLNSPKFSK